MSEGDPTNCMGCYVGLCEQVGGPAQHHADISSTPHCLGCGKAPSELSEYTDGASEWSPMMTPDEYVRQEEGTYGIKGPGTFYCTLCYVRAGMPINYSRMRF